MANKNIDNCPVCGGKCTTSWSGLELVENSGDETLATRHYNAISTQETIMGVLKEIGQFEFERMYFQLPDLHDNDSCKALRGYAIMANQYDVMRNSGVPLPKSYNQLMNEFAEQYGTTIEKMKQHWRCHPELDDDKHVGR